MPSGKNAGDVSDAAPLLLDTHYWIWLQLGTTDRISSRVRLAIEHAAASGRLLLSVISVWELGLLEAKGRIQLSMPCHEWVSRALATPGLVLAPLSAEIAVDSSHLPEPFHGDPADRIIISTARRMSAKLVTCDEKMRAYAKQHRMPIL